MRSSVESRHNMLRSIALRVGGRCTLRSASTRRTAVANSAKPSTRSALANRRSFATQNASDPKRHPRELDDDFEEVDSKQAPNLDKEEQQSQLPLIFDVDPDTFNEVVSTAPMPLIALFHIPGQPQCQQLDQKLQKLTLDSQGAIRMMRFDVSTFPEAAAELQIKAFPATIALHKNRMVTSFGGVPSDKQLESVFDQLMRVAGASSVKLLMDKANTELEEGNIPEAAKIFSEILNDPSLKSEALALSGLARCALKEGKLDAAQEIVAAITSRYPKDLNNPEIVKAMSSVELAANAGSADDLVKLEQNVKAAPNDPELRFNLGVKYSAVGRNVEAVDQLLESIKKDKHWNEQAARKHLLKIIESLGNDNDLALKARKRLSALWFV